jgi:4-amino-4-deoxy-L-arabinose transferase-like glycosyltransferase
VLPRLACLTALALALRLWGIAFGLPYIYTFDEPTSIGEALGLIHGTTDALSFANPPLYKYILVGLFGSLVGFQRLAEVGDTPLYLIARATSAVLGALTVPVVYWLAWLLRGRQAGLIAAGLAAATYLLTRESHFGVNDALATLCATAALAASVRVACRGTRRDYLMAGVGLGLAFAAKYQAAAILVPLMLAHVQHGRRRRDLDMLLALGAALVTAIVAFPQLVTETRRVVADVYVFLMLPSRLGFEGLDRSGAYVFYFFKSFGLGIGWPMLALAGVGIALAAVRREWPLLVVASLPVCLYVVMGSSHMYVARFMLPGLTALIVLTAVVLSDLARPAPGIAVVLVGLALAGTLPSTLRFDTLLTRPDTRTEARTWLHAHVPAGAHVIADPPSIGPPLDKLGLDLVSLGHAMYDGALADYRAQGIEYIVTSSYSAEAPNLDPNRDAHRREFYASLRRDADQLVEFAPYRGSEPEFVYDRVYGPFDSLDQFEQPGPTIAVFRLAPE